MDYPRYLPKPLRHTWEVLRRRRRLVIGSFLGLMALVALGTWLSPRAYRSQAKLFVRLGRENATLDPTTTLGQGPIVAVPTQRESEINSVIEMLNSPVLLEMVADRVGPEVILGQSPPRPRAERGQAPGEMPPAEAADPDSPRYRAVRTLKKKLRVEGVRKSNVIVLTYDGPSPEASQAIVEALLEIALERHVQAHRTPRAHQFLVEQANRQRALLTRSEDELRRLKESTGLIAPDSQRQMLVARIGRLEDDEVQSASALAAAEAEIQMIRGVRDAVPETQVNTRTKGVGTESIERMREQLYALQVRELELAARHPPGHPEVVLIRRQVAAAKAILQEEERNREHVTEGPSKLHEEARLALLRLESAAAAIRAKQAAIRDQLRQERTALNKLTEDELRLARLQRDVDLQTIHYRRYADNLEQTQIDRALELEKISNLSIVQPATYEPEPVRPQTLLFLAAGFVLALTGSVGLAFAAEWFAAPAGDAGALVESASGDSRAGPPPPASETASMPDAP